ncbi:hypothetical protein BZG36_00141 [Bifiguratus adelaidae]|uniref:CN hydrolase domain-containing protein n=1 Tax=Bifiguratus adelaidae TaxID=1938954 RepID=A0A261Y840_9FUNG|nr:hypothetical protein BZG36_00141 [Bifiguratus adelaidae]
MAIHSRLAAVGQFCATAVKQANQQACIELIRKASERQAKMVFLPEASDFIASNKEEVWKLSETLDGPFLQGIQYAAKSAGIWVSIGIHETSLPQTKVFNTQVIVSDTGDIVGKYRKIHLFDIEMRDGPQLSESDQILRGERLEEPVDTPLGKIGMQICYDLRFAEAAILMRKKNADILTYPSAFTVPTGLAHWEPLLRARAIETQCFVIASAQIGQHNEKRASFGHAMIIDPWGTGKSRMNFEINV